VGEGGRKAEILGVQIDVMTVAESLAFICNAVQSGRRIRVVTANPELLLRVQRDGYMRRIIDQADLVVPDGAGVVWAGRYLGSMMKERVTGIDLSVRLLAEAQKQGWRVFFLGGKPGVAEKAAQRQRRTYPGLLLATHHGYFALEEEEAVIERIRRFKPHLLLVGFGVPYQEYWLARFPDLAAVSMGVGGTFDVLSGDLRRAPKWIQNICLEWLYRLVQEPKRLHRQKHLPRYIVEVFKQKQQQQQK